MVKAQTQFEQQDMWSTGFLEANTQNSEDISARNDARHNLQLHAHVTQMLISAPVADASINLAGDTIVRGTLCI